MTQAPDKATHFRVYRWDTGGSSTECLLNFPGGYKVNTLPVDRIDYLTPDRLLKTWGPGQFQVQWLRMDHDGFEVLDLETPFVAVDPCMLH